MVRTGRKSASQPQRHAGGVAGHHHHGHRLADRPAHAEHDRGQDSRSAPPARPRARSSATGSRPSPGRVAVAARHRVQRILGHADDRGQRHVGQDQRAGERRQPGGHAQPLPDQRGHACHAEEARAPPTGCPPAPRSAASGSRAPSAAPTSRTKTAVATPSGTAMTIAASVTSIEPRISGSGAERPKVGYHASPKQVAERHFEQAGQALAQQEEEDQHHEADGREAQDADSRVSVANSLHRVGAPRQPGPRRGALAGCCTPRHGGAGPPVTTSASVTSSLAGSRQRHEPELRHQLLALAGTHSR